MVSCPPCPSGRGGGEYKKRQSNLVAWTNLSGNLLSHCYLQQIIFSYSNQLLLFQASVDATQPPNLLMVEVCTVFITKVRLPLVMGVLSSRSSTSQRPSTGLGTRQRAAGGPSRTGWELASPPSS